MDERDENGVEETDNQVLNNEIQLSMLANLESTSVDTGFANHINIAFVLPILCIGDDDLPQQSGQKDEKVNYDFIEFDSERLNIKSDKENRGNNDNLTCDQIELHPTISKNRLDLGSTSKELTKKPKNKSLISVVTRKIACSKCKNPILLHSLVKCMSCKKFFCVTCTEGQFYFDYICKFCFGDD